MTREEIKTAMSGLHSTFPAYQPKGGWSALLELWTVAFMDTPKELFRRAMSIHIQSGKRLFPSASELADIMNKLERMEKAKNRITEGEKIAQAMDRLPDFESSGCTTIPCPYLKEGQTDFCTNCVFEGGTK